MADNHYIDLNDLKSVYLFTGEVDSRRTGAVKSLVARLIDPGFETFDLERLDGDSASADGVLSALVTLPIASERKVVIVDRVDRMNPSEQDRIAAFLKKSSGADSPPMSCLVLLSGDENPPKHRKGASESKAGPAARESEDESDEEGKETPQIGAPKPRKSGLQPGLTAAVRKAGAVINMGKMKSNQMDPLVIQSVKEHGKKIEPPAVRMIVQSIFATPSTLDREVEKLAAYIGERETITVQDVDKVTTKSPDDRIFPLIDAIAIGRADDAVRLLGETFAASSKSDDTDVLRILAMIARHFRILYHVKYLTKQMGIRSLRSVPDELRSMLMREQSFLSAPDWQQNKLISQAGHFTFAEMERCLRSILACELVLKGRRKGAGSSRLNLEMLILKLCHRPHKVVSRHA